MSHDTESDHELYRDDSQQPAPARSNRLYWWNVPVKPENSLEAGQKMLTGTIIWFYGLILVMAIIGVLLAMSG